MRWIQRRVMVCSVAMVSLSVLAACEEAGNDPAIANLTEELGRRPPSVDSVAPASGPLGGGIEVTILGRGFRAGATVSFGGVNATSVDVISGSELRAHVPAHAAGAVDVSVTTARGASTLASAFSYAELQCATPPTSTPPTSTPPTSTPPSTPPTSTPPSTSPPPSPSSAGPVGQNASDYVSTFVEEFDTLDRSLWNDHVWYETPNATQNFAVENGKLEIWPERDASGNFFNRTLDTDGNYYQTYGFFEMEAKLPQGVGTWPAFWLFNHIGDRRPEIDIMEAYPGGGSWGIDGPGGVRLPTAYGATIWLDANVQGGAGVARTSDLSAAPHKYGLKWEPNKQTFYFDGVAFYAADVSMSDPMYIMLDLWFGSASGQPGSGTPTGKSNAYEVSYVRAWRFK